MPIIEKLGSFYLGKEYDLAARKLTGRPGQLRLARSHHPRGLRGHDRQRQDRSVHRSARRGGARRGARHHYRPQGRHHQPAAHLPRLAARGFPTLDQPGRRRGARGCRRMSSPPRPPQTGATGWRAGTGPRPHPTLKDAADFAIYTPGSEAGLPVSILSAASRRRTWIGTPRRDAARPHPGHRVGAAGAGRASRPTRYAAASTSCFPTSSRTPGAPARTSTLPS